MFINSSLFSKGIPMSAEPGLSSVLEGQRRGIVEKIRGISDLDQMTDSFLEELVKGSLVEPVVIQFGRMTRKLRTEEISRSVIPRNSISGRILQRGGYDDDNDEEAEFFGGGGNK